MFQARDVEEKLDFPCNCSSQLLQARIGAGTGTEIREPGSPVLSVTLRWHPSSKEEDNL